MATKDETGLGLLAHFSSLNSPDKDCVRWRYDGKTYQEISDLLLVEHDFKRSKEGVRSCFGPDGRLEQALSEYRETIADAALDEAKTLARRLSKTAILTMGELMNDKHADNIRLGASVAIANKYVPDKQVFVDGGHETNLPDGIRGAMGNFMKKEEQIRADSESHADDAGRGGSDDGQAGGAEQPQPEPRTNS